MSRPYRIALVAAVVVPLACGGGSSVLPGGKRMSDLSESEARKFCEWASDVARREMGDVRGEYGCYSAGSFTGSMSEQTSPGSGRQACEEEVNRCLSEGFDDEFEDDEDDCEVPKDCDVTVAELERCFAASMRTLRQMFEQSMPSCDPATWNTDFDDWEFEEQDPFDVEECRSIPTQCFGEED